MNDLEPRLERCFQAVFPKLDSSQIRGASMISLKDWDSVATVNLLNLISEEFSVEVEWDRMEELNSFEAALRLINAQ